MHVLSFPIRVISRIECPSVRIELVREDEAVLASVRRSVRPRAFGRLFVQQILHSRQVGNLASGIDPTDVEASSNVHFVPKVLEYRVSNKQNNEADQENRHRGEVENSSSRTQNERLVAFIWPVQRVVIFSVQGVQQVSGDPRRICQVSRHGGGREIFLLSLQQL